MSYAIQWVRSLIFNAQMYVALLVVGILYTPAAIISANGALAGCHADQQETLDLELCAAHDRACRARAGRAGGERIRRPRRALRQRGGHMGYHRGSCCLGSRSEGARHGLGGSGAVGDDGDAVHAEKWSTTVLGVVEDT